MPQEKFVRMKATFAENLVCYGGDLLDLTLPAMGFNTLLYTVVNAL
jgi:hypothetical protein